MHKHDCFSELQIYGPSELLDSFQKHKLHFQKFIPYPAKDNLDYCEWAKEHWGTTSDNKKNPDPDAYSVMDCQIDTIIHSREPMKLCMRIWTSLTPPNVFLQNLIHKYPMVSIRNIWQKNDTEGIWIGYMENGSFIKKEITWQPSNVTNTAGY